MKITDKTVLVTGANRGLGRALVDEALRRGAKLVYAGMRKVVPDRARAAALVAEKDESLRRPTAAVKCPVNALLRAVERRSRCTPSQISRLGNGCGFIRETAIQRL